MRRIGTWTAAAVLSAGLLTGCGGGGDTEAYCDSMKEAQDDFSGSVDPSQFEDMSNRFQDLADEAPDEVSDDWDKLTEAMDGFTDALDDAGVSAEDLSDPEKAAELDPEALQKIQDATEALDQDEFTEASDNIEKHAKDECDLDLG